MKEDPYYCMKHNARTALSSWGFELFKGALNQLLFYTCTRTQDGHALKHINSRASPQIIKNREQCTCDLNVSMNGFQCQHEIAKRRDSD